MLGHSHEHRVHLGFVRDHRIREGKRLLGLPQLRPVNARHQVEGRAFGAEYEHLWGPVHAIAVDVREPVEG